MAFRAARQLTLGVPRASALVILGLIAGGCTLEPTASLDPPSDAAPALTYSPQNEYLADNCLRQEATRTNHTVDEALEACEHLITLVPSYVETPRACHDFHKYRFIEAGNSEQEATALAANEEC